MIPVCTAARVRAQDAAVIDVLGVPGRVLMEVAGRGIAEAIHARWPGRAACVVCGSGNNGGDGYVVARWLALWGHPVTVWPVLPPRSADCVANAALCAVLDIPTVRGPGDADVLVDALLGTGQDRPPAGPLARAVATMRDHASPVVAIDLPTGLHADTGQRLGEVAPAALTVTLGRWKPGLLQAPGRDLAGDVLLVDIGLDLAPDAGADAWIVEAADVAGWLPTDGASDAKWDRGHVAVRAGGGAAVLAAHGAFRGRPGLVTVLAPREEWGRLHGLWPEVILAEPDALDPRRHDALVLGPGLGLAAADEVRRLCATWAGPAVLDADALTILAATDPAPAQAGPRVLTPHAAEAARLLGTSRRAVDSDRLGTLARLARWGTPLLKGPGTLVGAPEGPRFNPTGSAALATAGTGDVLAGLVGAFLARGIAPADAASAAALVHGRAGEQLPPGATASDLVTALQPLPL